MGVVCSKNSKAKNINNGIPLFQSKSSSLKNSSDIFSISDSKLHNLLIKKCFDEPSNLDEFNNKNEFILLGQNLSPILKENNICSQVIDPEKLSNNLAKEIKILFDFKTLIIMKEKEKINFNDKTLEEFLKFLQNINVLPKKILIFNNSLENFLQNFDIFTKVKIFSKKGAFPFIIFDGKNQTQIPIHFQKMKFYAESNENFIKNLTNITFYSKVLKITQIIIFDEKSDYNINEMKKEFTGVFLLSINKDSKKLQGILEKKLSKDPNPSLLYIYEKEKYKEFLEFLVELMSSIFKCSKEFILNYLKEQMDENQINLMMEKKEMQNMNEPKESKIIKKKSSNFINENNISRCDQMKLILEELQKNKKNAQQIKEIINKLLNNLINDPNNEKFRSIKATNESLKKTIFSSTSSKKLIELCGFLNSPENPEIFYNVLDILNIKIIKSDFDLASKNI